MSSLLNLISSIIWVRLDILNWQLTTNNLVISMCIQLMWYDELTEILFINKLNILRNLTLINKHGEDSSMSSLTAARKNYQISF